MRTPPRHSLTSLHLHFKHDIIDDIMISLIHHNDIMHVPGCSICSTSWHHHSTSVKWSPKQVICVGGMVGSEPMPSKSTDWTQLSPSGQHGLQCWVSNIHSSQRTSFMLAPWLVTVASHGLPPWLVTVCIIHGSESGRNRPGYGWHAASQNNIIEF